MSYTSSCHRRMDSHQSFQSNDSSRSSTSRRTNSVSSSIYSNDDYVSNIKPFKKVRFDDDPVIGSFFDFESEDEKPSLLRRTYRKSPIFSIVATNTTTATTTPKTPSPAQMQSRALDDENSHSTASHKLRSFMSLRLSRSSSFLRGAHDEQAPVSENEITQTTQTSSHRRVIGPISRPIYSSNWGDGLSPSEMI
ncbi:Hypothetical protein R9X50_00162800 [Acrodontium crateriforme]|uniref:Uncharacterized protein n=1 Tax=Acrodontium crateriforme TaxID=150365 RepID=A0AAQ3R808_9PEZI|nr:Hypothetical protein R9X50_00162800 [Acrodontium crateriforme]